MKYIALICFLLSSTVVKASMLDQATEMEEGMGMNYETMLETGEQMMRSKKPNHFDVTVEMKMIDGIYKLKFIQKDGSMNRDGCGYKLSDLDIDNNDSGIGIPEKHLRTGTITVTLALPMNQMCAQVMGKPRTATTDIEHDQLMANMKYNVVVNEKMIGTLKPGFHYNESGATTYRRRR